MESTFLLYPVPVYNSFSEAATGFIKAVLLLQTHFTGLLPLLLKKINSPFI